ncbi:MAG: YdcF family protein [Planctomycetota bacterium]
MLWLLAVFVSVGMSLWLLRQRVMTGTGVLWYLAWAIPLAAVVVAVLHWPTMFELRKAVALLVMPMGLIWLALIALWILLREHRGPALGLGLVVTLFTLLGNAWVGGALVALLEAPYRDHDPFAVAPLDAVLVLGGGTGHDPFDRAQLGEAGDRLRLAAALQRRGRIGVLVASGRHTGALRQPRDHARDTRALWLQWGVNPGAIHLLPQGRNTSEELAAFTALCRERGWRRVGVLSSAWHLRRATAAARAHGIDPVPLPADFRGGVPPPTLPNCIVQHEAFELSTIACWETLGRVLGQ